MDTDPRKALGCNELIRRIGIHGHSAYVSAALEEDIEAARADLRAMERYLALLDPEDLQRSNLPKAAGLDVTVRKARNAVAMLLVQS